MVAEDEMVGWHYQLSGREFEQALGNGEGKPGLLQSMGLQRVGNDRMTFTFTGKTIALTIWTFVSKAIPLVFNMLYRFVIAFLPMSKCL